MPTILEWQAPEAIQTYLSTEMNSLADGANKLGAAIDNETDGSNNEVIDLELTLATQASARSEGATVDVYLLPSIDGTNYCFGGDSLNPPERTWVDAFELDAATTGRVVTLRDIPIPPYKFKLLVQNNTGQALAASGNTLKYRRHSRESQ